MSLFKKPSELTAKPGIVAMIYGSPGSGKSTLACSAPNAVMIDTDGGVMRINGAHQIPTLQVKQWEEILEAIKEVTQTQEVESVVIDTVGKMMMFMEDYMRRFPTMSKGGYLEFNRDGSLSQKGYGRRKQMFIDFVKSVTLSGKNIIFVAHDKEDKRGDDVVLRPEVGGSSTNDLMKELDLVGYMEMVNNVRTISFTPTDRFYAKNTCDMPGIIQLPVLIDDKKNIINENNFFGQCIANYKERIYLNIENNKKLEDLKELIYANIEEVTNAEEANRFVEWVQGLEHIYNSKAIASKALQRKTQELGLKYDKKAKSYVPTKEEPENKETEENGAKS